MDRLVSTFVLVNDFGWPRRVVRELSPGKQMGDTPWHSNACFVPLGIHVVFQMAAIIALCCWLSLENNRRCNVKVGDLVYNHSIEMKGIIVSKYIPKVGSHVTTGPWSTKLRWFVLLFEDGGIERANNLELEVIS